MSEETQVKDPGTETSEPASSPQSKEPSQEYVSKAEMSALEKRILDAIEGSSERTKQSQRDAIKDRVEGVEERLLKRLEPVLAKAGVNVESERKEAVKDILVERFLANSSEDSGLPQAPGSKSLASDPAVSPESLLISKLLEDGGLSKDQPEIKKWLSSLQAGKSFGAITRELTGLIDEIGARKEPSGDIAVDAGLSPSHKSKLDELIQGYRKEALAARGKGMPELRKIQDKYRQLGLKNPHEVPVEEWVPLSERKPKLR